MAEQSRADVGLPSNDRLWLSEHDVWALRSALARHDFTVAGVRALVGDAAHAALARNETTAALRRTGDGSPLSTLTRLWPLQAAVPDPAAERALPGLVDPLCAAELLERSGGEVLARVDVRPYADDSHDWWVVADLTPGLDGRPRRMSADHVLGVSPASVSLAQLTVRQQVGRALDLGAGSGVQSLHLSSHAGEIVATDVNRRALRLAALTSGLNDISVELREGSLYEPVRHDAFDLIVTNPPFVISSGAGGEMLTYRDSGLPGDEVVRRVVVEGAQRLAPGGWLQVLANWVVLADQPWDKRLREWIAPTGCDAWVVERERLDPAQYVEIWLDDAGLRGAPEYRSRYDAWLGWLENQHVEAIGLGWLSLRRAGRTQPCLRIEAWPYEIEQPIGLEAAAWAARVDALEEMDDQALLSSRLRAAPDLVQEHTGPPGEPDPAAIVLKSPRGMRRARLMTTAEAAFVGACDGELSVDQIVDALAELLESDGASMRAQLIPAARALLLEGYLLFP